MKELTERELVLATALLKAAKEALELDFGPLEDHTDEAFEVETAACVAILRVALNLPIINLERD